MEYLQSSAGRMRLAFALVLAWGLVCGCSGGSGGGAPSPLRNPQPNGSLGEIVVVNKSVAAGFAVAEVVVPVARGVLRVLPKVRTGAGEVCQAFAMGALHDDASIRYLRIEVPTQSTSRQQQSMALTYTDAPDPVFRRHPVQAGAVVAGLKFAAAGTSVEFPAASLIESGPLSETYRSRLRVPGSMLWAELHVTIYSDQPAARFTLQWGVSDPRTADLHEDPGSVEFQVSGPRVEFEHQDAKVLELRSSGASTMAVLHRAGFLGDGQSQLLEGRLVYAGDSPPRVFAMSKQWHALGGFGPFGELLPEIRVHPAEFAALVADNERRHQKDPWASSVHGCNPSPSNSGFQADFGSTVMRADVLLADPSRLQTIIRSVYQEACRMTHYREEDVSRVVVANHPELLTLTGRPKNEGSSPDMLGKQRKVEVSKSMRSPSGARWKGHDTQHLSINYLASIALLTGNRFARDEVAHHCMLYLTGFTYQSGSFNDEPGASRQVGRSSLAAIWMWLVSGREDIKQRVIDRARFLATRVRSFPVKLPVIKPRRSNTEWYGWEEGNGVTGLWAIYRHFQTAEALEVVHKVARTLVHNGYARLSTGEWRIGYQMPMESAAGNAYVASADPDFAARAAGRGLTVWGIPGVFIAAEHHPDAAIRAEALAIIKDRFAAPLHGLDEALQWIGVSASVPALGGMTSAY